jgi:hypothetical protein
MNLKHLIMLVEQLYTDRLPYMILLQEISEHFYPQRADFTIKRNFTQDYAGELMTSYPVQVRRDLGDQIGQMLRPTSVEWFEMIPKNGEKTNNDGKQWLDEMTKRMRLAMYAKPAKFARMSKECDHDFASFGACPFSVRLNRNADNLLYRNWHIRDMAWHENEEGGLGVISRKWHPTARDLKILFGDKVDPKVNRLYNKDPLKKIKCFHIYVESDMYDDSSNGRPWFSIYYDAEHNHLMEAVPVWTNEYRVPRWQTVSGSQYPFSPATITALPDARLIQSMAYTLLEAGEKATNPPLLAVEDAIRSDVAIYAGGITWVDRDYDNKLNQALSPLNQDLRGLPFGQDMVEDTRMQLLTAFFLNKLTLPERAPEMTAYEVGQRIQEYIRGALPIFEPMEPEYNGGICEVTFETLFRAGVFGSPRDIPPQLMNDGIDFQYRSPLHDAINEQQGQKFLESKALIAEALDLDRGAAYVMDARTALRGALDGVGVPAEWLHSEDDVDDMVEEEAEAQQEHARLEQMLQGSEVAKNIGQAGQDLEMV